MMNRREIMKRAWMIKREDERNIFGLCLKMAWAEAKAGKDRRMELKRLIEKYGVFAERNGNGFTGRIGVRDGKKAVKDGVADEIKAMKQEILDYFHEEDRKEKERQIKIDAIPGLQEILKAQRDLEEYNYKFRKSFEDVGGLGVGQKPDYDFEAAYERYPQAAAYLKAEKKADSVNIEISEIGRKALERVIDGDYEKAIDDMETELKAFAEKHMWD